MIKIFTGEDRVKIQEEIERELGSEREVFEGEGLARGDLDSVFFGTTLFFTGERKILIKDLGENKEVLEALAERIEEFLKTETEVILFETKLDKRLTTVKKIIKAGVEVREFKAKEMVDTRMVFNIYDLALRDGRRAVEELEKIEAKQDPYMFFGLMVSQALKKLEWKPNGVKEKRIVRELAEVDKKMKSTGFEPWTLVKGLLVRLSSL